MDPFYHTLFQCSIAAGNEEIVLNHRYCIIKIYLVTGHSVETRDQLGNSTYISRSSIRVWIEYQHKQNRAEPSRRQWRTAWLSDWYTAAIYVMCLLLHARLLCRTKHGMILAQNKQSGINRHRFPVKCCIH